MPEYFTELQVSLNTAEEYFLRSQGFRNIAVNLNIGAGGNTIHLWYKKGMGPGITNIQFSFNQPMTNGLIEAGYEKVDKNLNEGAGGDQIYLWYSKSDKNVPIVDIDVIKDADAEAQNFKDDWERLACDLNRNIGGNWIYLFVKREKQTYIADIKATVNCSGDERYFKNGYIRVDESTNRGATEWWLHSTPPTIFLWYRLTTNSKDALRDLKISTKQSEYENYQQEGYLPVNQNLSEETGGNEVFLWYKKDGSKNPIKAVTVITNPRAVEPYLKAGVNVIQESLNTGNNGVPIYLCFNQ
ncbi:choriolysin H [Sarotherodon galilaeus]